MKLAEALLIRADIQNKLDELERRLGNNATVQEGEAPAEDPRALLKQFDESLSELEALVTAINLTNAAIRRNGVTLTEMLARRDAMKLALNAARNFLDCASNLTDRARRSEIVIRPTIPVAEIRKDADARAAALRKLEIEIQSLNWESDLIEKA